MVDLNRLSVETINKWRDEFEAPENKNHKAEIILKFQQAFRLYHMKGSEIGRLLSSTTPMGNWVSLYEKAKGDRGEGQLS